MRSQFPIRMTLLLCLVVGVGAVSRTAAEVPQDQAADMLLNSARKAYNERNYPFAIGKFQEYIQKYGGGPQGPAARYGLALCYLDGPERSFEKAIEPLSQVVGNANVPEYASALYFLGVAQRGLAIADLNLASEKQGDGRQQLRARADGRLQEAARHFSAAVKVFGERQAKSPNPAELDWLARARCDQAEMELRLNRFKEARVTAEPFTKDPALAANRYRPLGLYYFGYAAFLTQDYLVAGRWLNELSPFNDPVFGTHARYLMGRIYQASEEPDKALVHYDAVLADHEKQKKEAIELLKKPGAAKADPDTRKRWETLGKGPPPDHLPASSFYSACLLYEAGKFGESLSRFQAFPKEYPASAFEFDAALRSGYCQVQLKQYAEAVATLAPLVEKNPKISDQVLYWLGKAHAGMAQTTDAAARENSLKTAATTLRQAADRIQPLLATEPAAKKRRVECLLELADCQQQARQYKEAAALLEQLRQEKANPDRDEEIAQRLIAAQHLAGDYARSELVVAAFQKEYPTSALLPLVLFRSAENAYFTALASEKKPEFPKAELPRLFEEVGKRYKLIVDRYPESERVSLARYGLAMCHFKRKEFEEAQKILEEIPAPERIDELAYVPYLLAECLLRSAPERADDALQVGMLQEKLQQAQQNLEAFLGNQPKAPEAPDARLKLGICQTRLAVLIAQPPERNNALAVARKSFETLMQAAPNSPQGIQAVLERAKTIAAAGDKNAAINELRRFNADPLQTSSIAPLGAIYLATLLREQNKAEEAANLLNGIRQRHDGSLQKDDPERLALLRYHHGVCLQEAGKLTEARVQFETIPPLVPGKPLAAEASLRGGQSKLADARKMLEPLRQQMSVGNLMPQQKEALNTQIQAQNARINESAQLLFNQAEEYRERLPVNEARARMYYEAAWGWRLLADQEVAASRSRLQAERQKVLQEEANKKVAPGSKPLPVPLPAIPRATVPIQPSEEKARQAYRMLVGSYTDTLLGAEARLESAEMLAERDEHAEAIKLLKDALDIEPADGKQPSPELLDKLRLRLGDCLLAMKEYKLALEKFAVVADNPKSPLVAHGVYRAGECHFALDEPDQASARLALFRDKPEFHNVPGISDRALLRLGQSLALQKQWEPARQAFTTFTQRYGNSPWINYARYGLGWAGQNLGQFDQAVEAYNGVIANCANELAARAHLQAGLCRLEQKRYADAATALLVVPYTFDFPDLNAAALTEAARALRADNKPEQASRLLHRVIKEYPQSDWAKIAKQRLDGQ